MLPETQSWPPAPTRASPARSRMGISFPEVLRNVNVGSVAITVSTYFTVASIPPATFAMRQIVSKFCSTSRGYHAIFAAQDA